jgi:hypothetical protein
MRRLIIGVAFAIIGTVAVLTEIVVLGEIIEHFTP